MILGTTLATAVDSIRTYSILKEDIKEDILPIFWQGRVKKTIYLSVNAIRELIKFSGGRLKLSKNDFYQSTLSPLLIELKLLFTAVPNSYNNGSWERMQGSHCRSTCQEQRNLLFKLSKGEVHFTIFFSTSSNVLINVIERFRLYPYYHLDFPTKLRGVCEVKMAFILLGPQWRQNKSAIVTLRALWTEPLISKKYFQPVLSHLGFSVLNVPLNS